MSIAGLTAEEQYGEVQRGAKIPMHCAVEPEKTREAALLGLKLIDWYFGSLHHSIAVALNAHGRLNLKELVEQMSVRHAEEEKGSVSAEAAKLALVTLIRHNCVVVHEWKSVDMPGRPQRCEYLYELDMPRTLNLLRLPLFSRVLQTTVPRKQLFESRLVMQVLWNEGRLSLDALVETSIETLKARWQAAKVANRDCEDREDGEDGEDREDGDEGEHGGTRGDGAVENGDEQKETNEETAGGDGDEEVAGQTGEDARLQAMTDEELLEHMRDMVNDLINRQLIEKAPACSLSPPEDFVHENAQKKKSNKDPEGEDQVRENDLRVHGQSVRDFHSTNRFMRRDTWGKPSRKVAHVLNEGSKSYHVQMDINRPQDDKAVTIAPEDEIWRVNFQELNRRVYNGIAVETIRTGLECIEGIDPIVCGRVVEAMLYATKNPNPEFSNHASVVPIITMSQPMTVENIRRASEEIHEVALGDEEIREAVKVMLEDSEAEAKEKTVDSGYEADRDTRGGTGRGSTPKDANEGKRKRRGSNSDQADGQSINKTQTFEFSSEDMEEIRKHIEARELNRAALPTLPPPDKKPSTATVNKRRLPPLSSCLKGVREKNLYRFDTPTALYIARTSKLLEIIEQRFGPFGKRIWNMLYTDGQMEQKSISQDSMLGNTRPREILYAMFRNGFVSLQDIPRNADRAPSRTFYTWRATIASAIMTTAVMLYKSASNMLQMLQDIMTSDELNDITKRMDLGIGFEEDIFTEIHFKKDALVDNLLMLDEEIALFQFGRVRSDRIEDLDLVDVDNAAPRPERKRGR